MPVAGDIFDVKNALAAILAGPAFLAALEAAVAEKQDGLPVPTPENVYTEETLVQNLYPSCELVAFTVTYQPDTQVKQGRHKIGIRWTVIERDERTATRAAELLARATVDLLWDDGTTRAGMLADFNVGAGPVSVLEEDYSPLVPRPDSTFVKSCLVLIEVETWRD